MTEMTFHSMLWQMIYRIINETVRENLLRDIQSQPLGFQVKMEELKRSNQANALYWKWVTIIAEALGYHPDEMHESFKREFIGVNQGRDYFGNLYLRPASSARLGKSEFSAYMNKVQIFASQMNIKLPQPDYYGMEKI